MKVTCAHCGKDSEKPSSAVNRAKRINAPLYCNRTCSGLGRRIERSKVEKVELKRVYDAEYRAKNVEMLKAKKHAWFKQSYDAAQAAIERKAKMPKHVEYCRQPRYKEYKQQYDRQLRLKKYGPFADSYLLLQDLIKEVDSRMTRYEVYAANGTLNKRLERKREHERIKRG